MLMVALSEADAVHLAVAIRMYLDGARRDYRPVPPAIADLLEVATEHARARQSATAVDVSADPGEPSVERWLFTFEEAGSVLAVSGRTVQRLVRRGDLPAVEVVAGARRICREDLETYVAQRRDRDGGDV